MSYIAYMINISLANYEPFSTSSALEYSNHTNPFVMNIRSRKRPINESPIRNSENEYSSNRLIKDQTPERVSGSAKDECKTDRSL